MKKDVSIWNVTIIALLFILFVALFWSKNVMEKKIDQSKTNFCRNVLNNVTGDICIDLGWCNVTYHEDERIGKGNVGCCMVYPNKTKKLCGMYKL